MRIKKTKKEDQTTIDIQLEESEKAEVKVAAGKAAKKAGSLIERLIARKKK
jgi:hypothetical protein